MQAPVSGSLPFFFEGSTWNFTPQVPLFPLFKCYHWILPNYLTWNIKNNNSPLPSLFSIPHYHLMNYCFLGLLLLTSSRQTRGLSALFPAMFPVPKHSLEHTVCVQSHFSLTLCNSKPYIACQDPLSIGFCRQEHCSGFPCPPPRDFPDPGIELTSPVSPVLAGGFFSTSARTC